LQHFAFQGNPIGRVNFETMGKRGGGGDASSSGGRKAAKVALGPWVDRMVEAIGTIGN